MKRSSWLAAAVVAGMLHADFGYAQSNEELKLEIQQPEFVIPP